MLFVVVFLVHWSLTTSRAESAAAAASSALSTTTPAVFSYAATATDITKKTRQMVAGPLRAAQLPIQPELHQPHSHKECFGWP